MTERWSLLLFAVLAGQSPGADSLRLLARSLSEPALAAEVLARPLAVREALGDLLSGAVQGSPAARSGDMDAARRLAAAYAVAWRDSFLVREVARFEAWPRERRLGKVWADSVRRAGVRAVSRRGLPVAMAMWQRAWPRAMAIGDTAGAAATLGNVGAGLSQSGRLDSAEACLERARRLARSVGDLKSEAFAVAELAGVAESRDDPALAREHYARALELWQRIGDSRGVAAGYNNLGNLALTAGDLDGARRQFESALALNRQGGRDDVAATNLVNLAGIASLAGDFARAESWYREALAVWRARGEWADAADAFHGLGQLQLRRGDYPAARVTLLEALAIYRRTGATTEALAVRRDLAGGLAAAGDLQGALDELRDAQRLADSVRAPSGVRAGLALGRADMAAQLNARAEADRLYAAAEALYRQARNPAGAAETQEGRGLMALAREDYGHAQPLIETALRTQLGAGDARAAALTRLSLGELLLARGDTTAARQQLVSAIVVLDRIGDAVGAAAALGERAALESAARLPVVADSLYRAALSRVGDRVAPEVTWRLHAGLAAVRRGQGASDEAAREFRTAIADVERTGRAFVLPERRSGFMADKADVFARLAQLERDRGRLGAAFEVSERARAREMNDLLARGRVAAPSDAAAEIVAREQDLRRRIAELTHQLEGARSSSEALRGPDVSQAGGVAREALLRAQESYGSLLLEMRERAPRQSALVTARTATWRDVARHLAADEAFVEYLVSDSSSLAFVITRDTIAALDLGIGRQELARLVRFVRGTVEPRGAVGADSLWRAPLRRLHAWLLTPLEASGLLAGKTRLTLVPHGDLHYLPFAALIGGDGDRFLIERYELVVTPSASVWLTLGERPAGRATSGILALAPKPGVLPASGEEVSAIAALAGSDVLALTGGAATEEAFRHEAPTRRVLHLATYGVLNKQNPLFSFVELAPDGANDGRLEVHEVFGLTLAADLVVLSACQTALGSGAIADVPPGDDWIGLARAFLHAGASRVMASLWPVQDRATATLMERFYRAYGRGTDPGAALAAAQRTLLAVPATAHPYYWAGFELVGER